MYTIIYTHYQRFFHFLKLVINGLVCRANMFNNTKTSICAALEMPRIIPCFHYTTQLSQCPNLHIRQTFCFNLANQFQHDFCIAQLLKCSTSESVKSHSVAFQKQIILHDLIELIDNKSIHITQHKKQSLESAF